jgi:hypothetical protein
MPYKVGDYARFHKSPRMKQERALRNKNRRAALRTGVVLKGDKRQIDHRDGNPRNNTPNNLRVVAARRNRKKQ